MDLLHAINFLEIQNAKQAGNAQAMLGDLKDQADYLRSKGVPVKSWFEFKQELPQERPEYLRNATIGAGFGATLLGGVGLMMFGTVAIPAALVTGALFGGLVGGYHETESSQRNNKVGAYAAYLEKAAHELSPGLTLPRGLSHAQPAPGKEAEGFLQEKPSPVVAPEMIAASHSKAAGKACACKG